MAQSKVLPSVEYLRKRLRYDPETGRLFWKDSGQVTRGKNTGRSGKEAFTTVMGAGYRQGTVDGVRYYAHRVAYAIYYGAWPTNQIDHVNGVRGDNRIINLRVATNQENSRNRLMYENNTSGTTGVCWHKAAAKWMAYIVVDGKQKYLGVFSSFEKAIEARTEAIKQYGFTDRHGKPINVGEACD